jgi:hypothetical protein
MDFTPEVQSPLEASTKSRHVRVRVCRAALLADPHLSPARHWTAIPNLARKSTSPAALPSNRTLAKHNFEVKNHSSATICCSSAV